MAREAAVHVVDDAVPGRVLAREDRGTVRGAEGDGVEGVDEERTLQRQPIDVRSLEIVVARDPELVPAEVVDDDDDDVRARARPEVRTRWGTIASRSRLTRYEEGGKEQAR